MLNSDRKQIEMLVLENQGLVRKIANRYAATSLESFEDLQSVGQIGLIKAAQRFDADKGFRFSSIAVPWIRGEILHYLRDRGGVPRIPKDWRDLYMKGFKLPDAAASEKCGISISQWQEIKTACSVWLCEFEPHHEPSWETTEPEPSLELDLARGKVQRWLNRLSSGDRDLVQAIYYMGEPRHRSGRRLREILATIAC